MSDTVNTPLNNLQSGKTFTVKLILLVEDDCDDSEIIINAIKEVSPLYDANCYSRPEEALTYLESLNKEEYPSLIITDINLPAITGIQLVKRIKQDEKFKEIPIAVYSSSYYPKFVEEAILAGACIYKKKKESLNLIKEDIKEILTYCK